MKYYFKGNKLIAFWVILLLGFNLYGSDMAKEDKSVVNHYSLGCVGNGYIDYIGFSGNKEEKISRFTIESAAGGFGLQFAYKNINNIGTKLTAEKNCLNAEVLVSNQNYFLQTSARYNSFAEYTLVRNYGSGDSSIYETRVSSFMMVHYDAQSSEPFCQYTILNKFGGYPFLCCIHFQFITKCRIINFFRCCIIQRLMKSFRVIKMEILFYSQL